MFRQIGYGLYLCSLLLVLPVWAEPSDLRIERVFFAQQHVLEPDNPLFTLTGDLPALIKVHVYSDDPVPSPVVVARLSLRNEALDLFLQGPSNVPSKQPGDPVLMKHSYGDSYTAVIPRQWIQPGLQITVELLDYDYTHVDGDDKSYAPTPDQDEIIVIDRRMLNDVNVGAPTKLVMQMFDIHYFGLGKGADYPQGWETELAAKLPISQLVVHRVKNIMFNEIVMPPQFGKPSARYASLEDYEKRTGKPFDGEQSIALKWCQALKDAGGLSRYWRPYHINIAGVYSGGQAGGYRSCANLHRHGVLIHELGHTFGLPHWDRARDYPYKRTMYGLDRGEQTGSNAGPTWAYDIWRGDFLSPCDLVDGEMVWRNDPMQGGGRSNLKNYMYKHFSDYSVDRMRNRFENLAVYWNPELGQYAKWTPETAHYDNIVENDGIMLPVERDADVVTILVSANAAVADANIIYPPIGPYKAGLILRFDSESDEDRQRAVELGYATKDSNVALRVTQGGKVTSYLLRSSISPDDDPLRAFSVAAINLPARDGSITKVDLLYCPDLIEKGMTGEQKTLYRWRRNVDSTNVSREVI